MAINWGDAFVQSMRAVVVSVGGLPAVRLWANTVSTPPHDAESIDDGLMTMDAEPMEVGPGAWKRTEAAYRVALHVPIGGDVHRIASLAAAIETAFWAASITVQSQPLYIRRIRIGPPTAGDTWYTLPLVVATTFDHP